MVSKGEEEVDSVVLRLAKQMAGATAGDCELTCKVRDNEQEKDSRDKAAFL